MRGWRDTGSKPVDRDTKDDTGSSLPGQDAGKIRSWSSEGSIKTWT